MAIKVPNKGEGVRAKFLPKSTSIPNWFFDELLADKRLPGAAVRIFLFLWRQTVGWNRRSYSCSVGDIEVGCGVTKRQARRAIELLTGAGIFSCKKGGPGVTSRYTLAACDSETILNRVAKLTDALGRLEPLR